MEKCSRLWREHDFISAENYFHVRRRLDCRFWMGNPRRSDCLLVVASLLPP